MTNIIDSDLIFAEKILSEITQKKKNHTTTIVLV